MIIKQKIDFICLGASKSGTTAIANFLNTNPNIFVPPIKEIYYFNKYIPQDYLTLNVNFSKGEDWYHSHFKFSQSKKILNGELTPCYLNSIEAVKRIKQYNPKIKLFVILRDPVYRAYSQYLYATQNGIETNNSFIQALKQNPKKYIGESMYYKNLNHYYKEFEKSQIKIFLYEDFFKDINKSMKELFAFLGTDHVTSFNSKPEYINSGKVARFPIVNILISRMNVLLKNQKFEKHRKLLRQIGLLSMLKFIKTMNLKERKKGVNSLNREIYDQVFLIFEKDINSLKETLKLNLNIWKFKEQKDV